LTFTQSYEINNFLFLQEFEPPRQ